MSNDREALIERVARKVCASANAFPCNKAKPICASCLEDADVFINLVMEEAAEASRPPAHMLGSTDSYANGYRAACADIAAALRAYITDPGTAS